MPGPLLLLLSTRVSMVHSVHIVISVRRRRGRGEIGGTAAAADQLRHVDTESNQLARPGRKRTRTLIGRRRRRGRGGRIVVVRIAALLAAIRKLPRELLVVDLHFGGIVVRHALVDALVGQKGRDLGKPLGKAHILVTKDLDASK